MTSRVFKTAVLVISILIIIAHFGCKKNACEDCTTYDLLVATAGDDQTIILPNDSAYLDAGKSYNPDGESIAYEWTKIAGPGSISIVNPTAVQTWIINLQEGIYQIELKVTDSLSRYAKDTVIIIVQRSGWTELQHLPDEFLFYGNWFSNQNFFMGIENEVFSISHIGKLWRYNAPTNSWLFVTSFPERMVEVPVTFSVKGMGYCIGDGHCWQYSRSGNQWTRKADPPAKLSAPLLIGNKVYFRTDDNHLLSYEPSTDTYTQQKDPPEFGNDVLGYFVIGEQGYYVTENSECWKYDASTDSWQRRADVTEAYMMGTPVASFSVNHRGYLLKQDLNGLGINLWGYDVSLNTWTKTNDYYRGDGYKSIKAAASLDSVAYIGLGFIDDFNAIDFWSYK